MTNVEKLSQIKQKLVKYSNPNQKDAEKIKYYITQLRKLEKINNQILHETGLLECLKRLKKSKDPEYSKEAEELLSRWKSMTTTEVVVKCEPIETSSRVASDQPPDGKKPRLSIADYKVMKKETENETTRPSVETSQSSFGIKTEPGSKLVPLPTMPLDDILSSLMPNGSSSSDKTLINRSTGGECTDYNLSRRPLKIGPSEDEVLANIFNSKHSKKMLYTGRRNHDGAGACYQPSKLFDLATRVLVDNLDDLPTRIATYNAVNDFPLAFDLIKGVLERANAKQLKTIEYYSPHLLDDTDYLWKKLSEQDFKKVEDHRNTDEDESWREYYFRKHDEREAKFLKVRDTVSRLQANKPKERQTQMATVKFVSSTTKPMNAMIIDPKAKSKPVQIRDHDPIPVRKIIHDSSGIRKPTAALGANVKKAGPTAPPMSQGMKATMKLIKKTIRR